MSLFWSAYWAAFWTYLFLSCVFSASRPRAKEATALDAVVAFIMWPLVAGGGALALICWVRFIEAAS